MTRKEEAKRAALKALLSGSMSANEALKQLGGVLRVVLIAHKDTHTWIEDGCGRFFDMPNELVPAYLEKLKKDHPNKRFEIASLDRKEFEVMSAKLEREY